MVLFAIMAAPIQYIEVLFFTAAMYFVSLVITKLSGTNTKTMMEMQTKVQQLQQEAMIALKTDPERARQLQLEMMEITQQTLKKTCIPSVIRMVIFFVFFGILNTFYQGIQFFSVNILIFGKGAVALYFLYSIGISICMTLIKLLIRKIKGETKPKSPIFKDLAGAMTTHVNSDLITENLPPELIKMRADLQKKQQDGVLPADIDIDNEIREMYDQKQDKQDLQNSSDLNDSSAINKSWKQRLKDKEE